MVEQYKVPKAKEGDTVIEYSKNLSLGLGKKISSMDGNDKAYNSRTLKMNKRLQRAENMLIGQTDMICALLDHAGIKSKEFTDKIETLNSKIDPLEFN